MPDNIEASVSEMVRHRAVHPLCVHLHCCCACFLPTHQQLDPLHERFRLARLNTMGHTLRDYDAQLRNLADWPGEFAEMNDDGRHSLVWLPIKHYHLPTLPYQCAAYPLRNNNKTASCVHQAVSWH